MLEPGLLPEHPALGLTTTVAETVAAGVIEQHRARQAATPRLLAEVVADLLEAFVHGERATEARRHLRHERHALVRTRVVERGEDRSR